MERGDGSEVQMDAIEMDNDIEMGEEEEEELGGDYGLGGRGVRFC